MTQVTLRLPEDLLTALRQAARARGQSLNRWVSGVLAAAVDPELAGDEAERVRERLTRAGLLAPLARGTGHRPDEDRLARARAAAGSGRSLADLVDEGRR